MQTLYDNRKLVGTPLLNWFLKVLHHKEHQVMGLYEGTNSSTSHIYQRLTIKNWLSIDQRNYVYGLDAHVHSDNSALNGWCSTCTATLG